MYLIILEKKGHKSMRNEKEMRKTINQHGLSEHTASEVVHWTYGNCDCMQGQALLAAGFCDDNVPVVYDIRMMMMINQNLLPAQTFTFCHEITIMALNDATPLRIIPSKRRARHSTVLRVSIIYFIVPQGIFSSVTHNSAGRSR